jgi:hypothetical protein
VLSQNTLDRAGHVVARGGGLDFKYLTRHCPNVPTPGSGQPIGGPILGKDLVFNCVQKLGLKTATTFQPLSRFWTFQWIEFGIYMGLTIALLGFVVWRINIAD